MTGKYVFLLEAVDDVEANIISGLLESAGIPARKEDGSPLQGAMRVVGGLAYEIKIFVPADRLEEARELIRKATEEDEYR